MGYDYYARQPSTPYPTGEYDHIIWSQWFDDPRNYLRRNMWGGARLAEAMVKLGMAYDVEQYIELPDWPEEWGCHWDDKDEDYVGPLADEYKKKLEEHLSWHGVSDIPGIPVHKIAGTNDSWHVTALECQAALVIYQQRIAAGEQHPESFRDDVIPFLEHCAKTDGFETR